MFRLWRFRNPPGNFDCVRFARTERPAEGTGFRAARRDARRFRPVRQCVPTDFLAPRRPAVRSATPPNRRDSCAYVPRGPCRRRNCRQARVAGVGGFRRVPPRDTRLGGPRAAKASVRLSPSSGGRQGRRPFPDIRIGRGSVARMCRCRPAGIARPSAGSLPVTMAGGAATVAGKSAMLRAPKGKPMQQGECTALHPPPIRDSFGGGCVASGDADG